MGEQAQGRECQPAFGIRQRIKGGIGLAGVRRSGHERDTPFQRPRGAEMGREPVQCRDTGNGRIARLVAQIQNFRPVFRYAAPLWQECPKPFEFYGIEKEQLDSVRSRFAARNGNPVFRNPAQRLAAGAVQNAGQIIEADESLFPLPQAFKLARPAFFGTGLNIGLFAGAAFFRNPQIVLKAQIDAAEGASNAL